MNLFEIVKNMMDEADSRSMLKSMDNVHHEGVFSLVVGGHENGQLTRIFIATKKIKPFAIQFHSHRYDLEIGVIKGEFMHHEAIFTGYGSEEVKQQNCVQLDTYEYTSPLNGGKGLEFCSNEHYLLNSYFVPVGGVLKLHHDDIHSVSVSKGTMWIVHEKGFATESSAVLGRPFVLDNLYTQPKQYQINDMWQKVYNALRNM